MARNPQRRPGVTASVVVSTYDDRRWNDLERCLASLEGQTVDPAEVILVVDHNPALLERARDAFRRPKVVSNRRSRGLAGARNSGVDAAGGSVVAFIDDDASATPGWLENLLPCFDDESVIGAGGSLLPQWTGDPPRWFPAEFLTSPSFCLAASSGAYVSSLPERFKTVSGRRYRQRRDCKRCRIPGRNPRSTGQTRPDLGMTGPCALI